MPRRTPDPASWLVALSVMACAPERVPEPRPPAQREPEPAAVALPSPAVAPSADAGTKPAPRAEPPLDRAAEMRWARERWPDDLAGVELDPPLERLMAWVKPGSEIKVWVTAGEYRCQRGALSRPAAAEGESESAPWLELALIQSERVVKGRRQRESGGGTIDGELRIGMGWSSSVQEADGSWTMLAGSGVSDFHQFGALSRVTEDAAYFDAEYVTIEPYCPPESLPCSGGGARSCETCSTIGLQIERRDTASFVGRSGYQATCKDPCPPRVDNPDKARIERLFANGSPIRGPSDSVQKASIYRSQKLCRAALAKR